MSEWTIKDVRELLWKVNEHAKTLDWDSEQQVARLYRDVIFLEAIIYARRWELYERDEGNQNADA